MSDSNHTTVTSVDGSKLSSEDQLSHVDASGKASMVDVGEKSLTRREATAEAFCSMNEQAAQAIKDNVHKKGDVLSIATVAGIQAAKRTPELIPLCHTIPLTSVQLDFDWQQKTLLRVRATAACTGQTGVEMEAMCAASVAALTIYDMCKSVDRAIEIQAVQLVAKSGGKSGRFSRTEVR